MVFQNIARTEFQIKKRLVYKLCVKVMRSLCGVAGLNQMYSTESVTKRFFFNMGATRDNLIWRNPDPEE